MGTNTGIGIGIGIPFKNNVLGEGKPYLPPEIKDSLKAVVIAYGKTNNDSDRAIVKNLVDASNPFVISNAAYKLNSGYGLYGMDFLEWKLNLGMSFTSTKLTSTKPNLSGGWLTFRDVSGLIPETKVKVSGAPREFIFIGNNNGADDKFSVTINNGVYTIPEFTLSSASGFYINNNSGDWSNLVIEQIPSFQGAFVTDGINDLITSAKTVQEMLGGSNEITVVSMMANLDSRQILCNSNYSNTNGYNVRNTLEPNGVISILGYTDKNGTTNNLNLIMGDKNSIKLVDKVNFNSDYVFYPAQYYKSYYQVAWYWTIIANKVLTTDEINQVIAYFNLDRTLRPDILCNITKQGITNDNHADFNDKLVDYSGNGRDIQMYNLAWKGGSGVAAKKFETIKDYLIVPDEGLQELTIYNEFSYKVKSIKHADRYWTVQSLNKTDVSYPITIIADKDIIWRNALNYTDENGVKGSIRKETNVSANTPTQIFILGFNDFDVPDNYTKVNCVSYATRTDITEFTVTFIPSYKGGILLDGINDFGKVTGMPVYKDYTVVADREIIDGLAENADGGVALKGSRYLTGAFCFDYKDAAFSFGTPKMIPLDTKRFISYQSKYVSNGISMNIGKATDNDELWIGRLGNDERYSKIAIRFLMSFPYSMSEFLIERQLKKHKLGTLYPNMVEFRPVIKANANYKITYYQIDSTNTWKSIKVGDYIVIGAKLAFQITFDNDASELKEVVSPQLSGIIVEKRPSNPGYNIYSYITSKSPQKINITIDEYIRFEDIVQPYPSLFTLIDYDTEEVYSWGSKLKLGARFKGNVVNLLPNMYEWQGNVLYNGEVLDWGIKPGVVAKEMVFSWNMPFKYLIDNNEPKVILSPRLLRIPNSSYKILGYIPDISGHGNHGKINNSAYAEGSGVNEDGSYQFDGVDDFVTIPTIVGGKQVFMKVNWNSLNHVLYDQRNNAEAPFCIVAASGTIAYNQRNVGGNTYIDGILNNHILVDDLQVITHNIVLNNDYNVANSNSFIGTNYTKSIYAKMSLYDFMLFDNISTDDKIKELNEYVGIEGNTE